MTFLVAGGDPTAHTMTFAVNEIVRRARSCTVSVLIGSQQLRHPKIYARLRAELDEHLSKDGGAVPSVQDVSKLKYLTQIIKETLRYNGPGFGTFRYTPVDVDIGGVLVPKNTTLALWNPQGIHSFSFNGLGCW